VDCPKFFYVAVKNSIRGRVEIFVVRDISVTPPGGPPASDALEIYGRTPTSIWSINVASSASAFELFTRFDTGQRCR
jgi:hypothetical protein